MASLTIENYVKAIYQISATQDWRPASTGKLAEALGVSPGTVTSMLKTLSESGLTEYAPYEGARLTEAGRTLALRVASCASPSAASSQPAISGAAARS